MTESSVNIEILASPEKVFSSLVSDRFNDITKDWIVMKWTSGGPVGLGSTAHAVGMGRNKGGEWDTEVTEFIPDRKLTMRSVGKTRLALDSTNSFSLEPKAKGTMVTYSINYDMPYSVLGKLLERLVVKRNLEKGNGKMLENLKASLES
jgi:hypothetical protein